MPLQNQIVPIEFNEHGLLASGIIDRNAESIESFLSFNAHRSDLWDNLKLALKEIEQFGITCDFYIDGSFVTDKPTPNDIELIFDVRNQSQEMQALAVVFHMTKHQYLKETYNVDCYPNLTGSSDFCLFFQYIGEKTGTIKNLPAKHLKGIIKLIS